MGLTNAQTEAEHGTNGTTIDTFFADTVVFVTGGTGFLGKALLEKLLRSCTRLATVYILIRPKRGQSVQERFTELMDNPIFDKTRCDFPGAIGKVFPVKGDVSMPDLGLDAEDRAMLIQRVNIVFHSAATVKFNEPLKVAVNLNTRGTDRMIELCKKMPNLLSFIHVSTAYSNADQYEIKEEVYRTKVNPQAVMDICDNLDDETMEILEKRLMGKHPNTYTLTKGLAEQLILTKAAELPAAIVRPSIICAAYKEPFPGWVDNVCGITGIIMQIGRGTMRSIVCDASLIVDVVPVDYVVDTLICASWHSSLWRSNKLKVYNCTSGTFNAIRWHDFGQLVRKHAIESPTKYVMWYPGFTFRTNKLIHKILVACLHFLPAFIVDLTIRFRGGKPLMMKLTKRFEAAAKTGEFFAVNEWFFHTANMENLMKCVKQVDNLHQFNVEIATLNWDTYVREYILGIRKYILKDSPETLTKARNRISKLLWVHRVTQVCGILFLLRMVSSATR